MLEFQNTHLEYRPLETQSLRFSISQSNLEATILLSLSLQSSFDSSENSEISFVSFSFFYLYVHNMKNDFSALALLTFWAG